MFPLNDENDAEHLVQRVYNEGLNSNEYGAPETTEELQTTYVGINTPDVV